MGRLGGFSCPSRSGVYVPSGLRVLSGVFSLAIPFCRLGLPDSPVRQPGSATPLASIGHGPIESSL